MSWQTPMSDGEPTVPLLGPEEAYARWAASYPPRAHNALMRAEERAVLSLLPPDLRGRTVLDAGCGSGRYTLEALRRGAGQVVGVDLSSAMLARAGQELRAAGAGSGVSLVRAGVEALPVRSEWADVVICGLTVGHLSALAGCLAELTRVVSPRGVIVCSDFHPSAYERGGRREFSEAGRRYAVRHTVHSLEDWRRECAAHGLRLTCQLEPHLEASDLQGAVPPEPAVMTAPVVLVLQLARLSARAEPGLKAGHADPAT